MLFQLLPHVYVINQHVILSLQFFVVIIIFWLLSFLLLYLGTIFSLYFPFLFTFQVILNVSLKLLSLVYFFCDCCFVLFFLVCFYIYVSFFCLYLLFALPIIVNAFPGTTICLCYHSICYFWHHFHIYFCHLYFYF